MGKHSRSSLDIGCELSFDNLKYIIINQIKKVRQEIVHQALFTFVNSNLIYIYVFNNQNIYEIRQYKTVKYCYLRSIYNKQIKQKYITKQLYTTGRIN